MNNDIYIPEEICRLIISYLELSHSQYRAISRICRSFYAAIRPLAANIVETYQDSRGVYRVNAEGILHGLCWEYTGRIIHAGIIDHRGTLQTHQPIYDEITFYKYSYGKNTMRKRLVTYQNINFSIYYDIFADPNDGYVIRVFERKYLTCHYFSIILDDDYFERKSLKSLELLPGLGKYNSTR